MPWTFLDYVDATGSNQIDEWLASLPIGDRARVRAELLAILIVAGSEDLLQPPCFKALQGTRMFEVKLKLQRVQYRILACYGPGRRDVTYLAGARKKNRYIPHTVFDVADKRRAEILSGGGRVVPTCLLRKIN
jgi:hypothetical protein